MHKYLGDNLRKSAVFIPFIRKNGNWHILFEKRSGNIRQPGEICFPGGLYEADKDSQTEDTASRELREELGLPGNQPETSQYFGTLVNQTNLIIDVYFGIISQPDQHNINLEEVAEILTIPYSWFTETSPREHILHMHSAPADNFPELYQLPERYQGKWHMRERTLYFYQWKNYTIWGITGEIMRHFCSEYTSEPVFQQQP